MTTIDDLKIYIDLFYSSHYIPLYLYKGDSLIYKSTFSDLIEPNNYIKNNLNIEKNPSIFCSNEVGMWGKIKMDDDYSMIFGSIFSTSINEEMFMSYCNFFGLNKDDSEKIKDGLYSLPKCSYYHFLNLLAFLFYEINGELIDFTDNFEIEGKDIKEQIATNQSEKEINYESQIHGTYELERVIVDYIKNGETDNLKTLFAKFNKTNKLQEGKLADTPIRQAKNIFIGATTLFGKEGAIKGGLDIEEAYSLIDMYIQECEKLSSLEQITALQYNMIIDFSRRVEENKIPPGISKEVHKCIRYINNHVSEQISLDDVSEHINKSRSYITTRFKKETGKTINEYIIDTKLAKSKSLLKNTDRSLCEIAYFLCFSTQAYFQTLFKKKYGITPNEYRKNHNS